MHIYIDGENFRHRLVDVLYNDGFIDDTEAHFYFDVQALLTKTLGETPNSVNYYTTRIHMPEFEIPHRLAEHIATIESTSHYWDDELVKQGVNVVRAGQLKVRESSPCVHCGKKTQVLHEKGVDVRLATDIVLAAIKENIPHIVLLSSDADMLPALQVVHHAGAKITYLCFAEELNQAVAAEADETRTYTRDDIIEVYKQAQ
jgi:uncharacterized LabA/DUF88 family protein